MNIGKLAELTGVTPDTLRFYEKEGLLEQPPRADNGYRRYGDAHAVRVRFIRGAQALGFSLAQIRSIVPQLTAGGVGRREIEGLLQAKIAEIDEGIARMIALKQDLLGTLQSLTCEESRPLSIQSATRTKGGGPSRPGRTKLKVV